MPCLTVEERVQRVPRTLEPTRLLAGERGGLKIDGFDLGNSPCGVHRSAPVGGKTVVMTTTNGTKALLHAASARKS